LDLSGQVEGVVYVAQSLNWLTAALANVAFPPGAILMFTDRNGTVLARMPDAGDWVGKTLPESQILDTVYSQKDGGVFEADDAQGVSRLWAHAPLIAGHDLRDDGNAEGGSVRRYQSTADSQSRRIRPGDDPGRDCRDVGGDSSFFAASMPSSKAPGSSRRVTCHARAGARL
jgi:hypothetical protein